MKILDKPTLDIDDEPGIFRLASPLLAITDSGRRIYVPKGFRTDLASIPFFVRGLPGFSVNGAHRLAAIVHDYLYTVQDGSRADADALFLEAMAACDVNVALRSALYAGVRAGGWWAWWQRGRAMAADWFGYMADNGLLDPWRYPLD